MRPALIGNARLLDLQAAELLPKLKLIESSMTVVWLELVALPRIDPLVMLHQTLALLLINLSSEMAKIVCKSWYLIGQLA
jgi:hypothetical protein